MEDTRIEELVDEAWEMWDNMLLGGKGNLLRLAYRIAYEQRKEDRNKALSMLVEDSGDWRDVRAILPDTKLL